MSPAGILTAVERRHPGWHLWQSSLGRVYATRSAFPGHPGVSVTLPVGSTALAEYAISRTEAELAAHGCLPEFAADAAGFITTGPAPPAR